MKQHVVTEEHPGEYVRENILNPKKLTVTGAAKILGIGRPALSNFLNGNASLSPDMAGRLERAFGIPAQKLHDLQATFDAQKTKGAPANTKAYVPPFLSIVANEIEAWSSSIAARSRLSVLLRRLVNSTGIGLTKVNFPGNDDSQRPGWDGFVNANEGTPWIPEGASGWEFGCNKEPKSKADDDYKKSVEALAKTDRSQITFVFVTPRRWLGKEQWVLDRKKEGHWKDVRAYDASDLEQWLEQSIAGQAWFANETKRPANHTRSLDQCWADWSGAAFSLLPGSLFKTTVEETRKRIQDKLAKPPGEPIVIAADSTEEAVAFLAEVFNDASEELTPYRDKVVVFDQPGVLPRLATESPGFIAVATTRDVERELAPFCRVLHTFVVYPRNAINIEPDVLLEPVNYDTFHAALEEAGYERDDINRLEKESGRSLTVLRRRLSKVPAVRTPAWAVDQVTAMGIIPFMFAGAWSSTNRFDQDILSFLAQNTAYGELEKRLQGLAQLNDAPVWSAGTYCGVVSKIDSLFAISGMITRTELETYFEVAERVLSEDDPSLDLPEKDRLFASLRGKTREISGTLRQGICESLVLLAVHGNTLFQKRLGIDIEVKSILLIRKLLGHPLSVRTLELHDRDLPTYAEVAPDEFLKIIEKDLKSSEPASLALMRPADTGIFGRCPRTGLLWALENLAWSPVTLSRTILILARLAEVKIDDKWANKPISSLKSIFRSWMPQTAASIDKRIAAMELLAKRHPKIAWDICVAQFGHSDNTGSYTHKPRWRDEARGSGNLAPEQERHTFVVRMVNMALSWQTYDQSMLGDLIERLYSVEESWQEDIWMIIKNWAATANDFEKAWVREKIRVTIMSRRGVAKNKKKNFDGLQATAKAAYTALEPTDILSKYEWLFRDAWVQESYDELHDSDLNYEQREERIAQIRANALQEVLAERGIDGILTLAEMGKAQFQIGAITSARVLSTLEITNFIIDLSKSSENADSWTYKSLVTGALWSIRDDVARTELLSTAKGKLSSEDFVKLLERAPFSSATWLLVDELDELHQKVYWREVVPSWNGQNDDELNELVDRLLAYKRPRAAFNCVQYKLKSLRPTVLFRLMEGLVTDGDELEGHYQLDSYYLGEAFEVLNASATFSVEQMAGLEFSYLDILSQSRGSSSNHGIPNLEKYIEDHPEFYAQVVAWLYKREDGKDDPDELQLTNLSARQHRANKAYKFIEALRQLPGRNKQGDIDANFLLRWVNAVRKFCEELGRQDVGDLSLGSWFAKAPKGDDEIWPCEPLRQLLEEVQSEKMSDGITMGLFNARGVHFRGEGGNQERELAAMYRQWALALEFSFPFVASSILERMAERYDNDAQDEDIRAVVNKRLI
ncbi:HigA family addiction module antitoxin [uncultured Fibrella sp.]|uniref:HigA family addiction module antitoxin n=1 Tax=uncultured Fibrella sp. TaxID=1284596 RepID=UPI0035C9D2B2